MYSEKQIEQTTRKGAYLFWWCLELKTHISRFWSTWNEWHHSCSDCQNHRKQCCFM